MNQVRSPAAGYPGLTWGATGWLGSKGNGLSPRKRGMPRSEASSPGFVTVTPACCDGKTAQTLPARPLCWPGDGSHRRDRALSCQPPRQVTARPQRHTYRKSLALTLKKKKHTKGQTSKSPTELFPTAKSQGACTGGCFGGTVLVNSEPTERFLSMVFTLLFPLSKCTNLSI